MLISFEGGDRCGKTTQIEFLKKEIAKMNKKVVTLKHPNRSTASGKIIEKYLKKELELGTEAITLCLTSNLWETSEKINEALLQGFIVLIDRYIHTNFVYSQIRGEEIEKLKKIMEGLKEPDVIIYLRAEGSVSERKDFGAERYETVEIQTQIQNNFDEIFSHESDKKIFKINSSKSIEEISKEVWENIKELL